MESLNMNNLASSLPNSANAEKQLMDNFKAAALSITTLYRSSLDTSKQAYSAGYATCLLDVLQFVEAGVSVSGDDGEEMTIGKVMDWIEARLEAIKSTAEEEEEDRLKDGPSKVPQEDAVKEEREKRHRKVGGGAPNLSRSQRRSKENLQEAPPNSTQQIPSPRLRSASSPAHSVASPSPPPPPPRPIRAKRGLKELGPSIPSNTDHLPFPVAITPNNGSSPFTFSSDVVSSLPILGSKRRHAAMLAESPDSSSTGGTLAPNQLASHGHGHSHIHPGRRKRGRSGRERDTHHGQVAVVSGSMNQGQGCADAMEVEEDGRERKRVTRR
ncbi:hypothetical protein JB92DRAFT_230318 [Gautieria morchelliformis]|nr:hypothetical protein JB92DRAFT_230318 [Gautieria morchelliformis]